MSDFNPRAAGRGGLRPRGGKDGAQLVRTTGDGTCGIVVCAKDSADRAHVLADHSVAARSPEGWARAVADAARIWAEMSSPVSPGEGDRGYRGGGGPGAAGVNPIPILIVAEQNQGGSEQAAMSPGHGCGCPGDIHTCSRSRPSFLPLDVLIVAEQNQGGRMVRAVLHTADPDLRVKPVTATLGKPQRAAPVAMLFEAGKIVLHGRFPELEAELLGMIAGGDYEGPGGPRKSPDRADAMVWALTELMLKPDRQPVRVRAL